MIEMSSKQNRPALGKGLASLLPKAIDAPPPSARKEESTKEKIVASAGNGEEKRERVHGVTMLDISQVEVNQFQPRRDFDEEKLKELSDSIKAKGVIQPLVVRRGKKGPKFLLIAGERRLRASRLAGLRVVPVVIRNSSDKETLELALIENIQRENLNCIEVALSYFQLMEDFQLTQEELASRVGKTRSSVANHVRLLRLPEEIIVDLRSAKLSFGHGKALLALKNSEQRISVCKKVVEGSLSVRDTEALVSRVLVADKTKESEKIRARQGEREEKEAVRHLTDRITRVLGTKVSFKGSQSSGSIVIKYYSREDLDRISEQLLR